MKFGADNSDQTFAGSIVNGTDALNLEKLGLGKQVFAGANSYVGITTISGGILSVANLKDGGTSSGIGSSASAATNLVLNGGALQYTGGAQSTNRLFTLTENGGGLDASGSGALTFIPPRIHRRLGRRSSHAYPERQQHRRQFAGRSRRQCFRFVDHVSNEIRNRLLVALGGEHLLRPDHRLGRRLERLSTTGNLGDGSATNNLALNGGGTLQVAGTFYRRGP